MDVAGELVQIYKVLEEQEAKLIELQRHLRALVTILESHPQLFDSYQSIYRGLGSSMTLREFEPTIEVIHEKRRVLSSERSEGPT